MPLHLSDYEDDLSTSSTSELERWFRALVRYPGEETIDGVSDPDDLRVMLETVAERLAGDENILPGDLFEHIGDVLNPVVDQFAGARYCDVAGYVAAHAPRFFRS